MSHAACLEIFVIVNRLENKYCGTLQHIQLWRAYGERLIYPNFALYDL